MRSVLISLLVLLVALPVSLAGQSHEDFERAASALTFFALDDFLYGRNLTPPATADQARRYNETLARLMSPAIAGAAGQPILRESNTASPDDVSTLLDHEDPNVRTLAMAWLFANTAPQALPHIAELVDDAAETVPAPQPMAVAYFPGQDPPNLLLSPQAVGHVARKMLAFYMERAGYYYGIEGKNEHPGFEEYWARRGERGHCLSWFAVKLDRATQGVSPLRYGAESRIRRVQREIEGLPPVEREVALLALFADKAALRNIVPEQDLLFAGRRLGPDRFLRLLQDEAVIDDPDLPHYRDHIRDFVLVHAAKLLRRNDAPWLISQSRVTTKADWFIAAADLQPESASEILRRAFDESDFLGDERTRTATALWRLAGPANEDFFVEWFWSDEEPAWGRAPYRAGFIDFLTERFSAVDRNLLAHLIRDERFEQLDWQTLESLLIGLNRNLLHPVVPPREIAAARHPLGKAHLHGMIERARKEYPRETAELLDTLDRWREYVRLRVTDWEPKPE